VVASFIAAGVLLFLIVISALALRKRWQINSYWSCFLDFASGVLWSRWWLTDERFFFLFIFIFWIFDEIVWTFYCIGTIWNEKYHSVLCHETTSSFDNFI
jgi:hypothetical protein